MGAALCCMAVMIRGGDGALFYFLKQRRPPFPEIELSPEGRGNALARDLGVGRASEVDLVEVRAEGEDGRWIECYSASSVGLGYPSQVTRRAELFRRLGRWSYASAAAFTLPDWREYELAPGGGPARRAWLTGVLVNNTRYTGGFEALRSARPGDGLVEWMELRAGYARQMVHNLSVISGLHCYVPARVERVRAGRIRTGTALDLMVDGELAGRVRAVDLRVLERALRVRILRPEKGPGGGGVV